MFKPRFASLVEARIKRQTVRPTPKRMPKAGDSQSNREWTGKPYRSKQRVLCEAIVISCEQVTVDYVSLILPTGPITERPQLDAFAKADGFQDWSDLVAWFAQEHGLPFSGILIKW